MIIAVKILRRTINFRLKLSLYAINISWCVLMFAKMEVGATGGNSANMVHSEVFGPEVGKRKVSLVLCSTNQKCVYMALY